MQPTLYIYDAATGQLLGVYRNHGESVELMFNALSINGITHCVVQGGLK